MFMFYFLSLKIVTLPPRKLLLTLRFIFAETEVPFLEFQ